MNGEHQPVDEMANVCHFASSAFVNQLFQIWFSALPPPPHLTTTTSPLLTAVAINIYNFGFALCCHQHRIWELERGLGQPESQELWVGLHPQLTDSSHGLLG